MISKTKYIALLLLLLSQSCLALNIHHLSNVYIFGDSLSDAGYLDNSRNFLPKGKRPTFTNIDGHEWGYYLCRALNLAFAPNNLNPPKNNKWVSGKLVGNNYAAGGSRAAIDTSGFGYKDLYNPPALQWQINQFLLQHNNRASPTALYIIWSGANDMFKPVLEKHAFGTIASIDHATNIIAQQIIRLQKAGAKYIVVINMPPMGDSPMLNDSFISRTIGNMVTDYFNTRLVRTLGEYHLNNIPIFNANSLFKHIYNQVKDYGIYRYNNLTITNVTDSACLPHHYMANHTNMAINCVAPRFIDVKHYMFADLVHPTDTAHQILASHLLKFLQALPQ